MTWSKDHSPDVGPGQAIAERRMIVAGPAIIESDSRVLKTQVVTTIREPQETMREPQPSCPDEAMTRRPFRIIVRSPAISCCGDPACCGSPVLTNERPGDGLSITRAFSRGNEHCDRSAVFG
jgi:hypothetical protein